MARSEEEKSKEIILIYSNIQDAREKSQKKYRGMWLLGISAVLISLIFDITIIGLICGIPLGIAGFITAIYATYKINSTTSDAIKSFEEKLFGLLSADELQNYLKLKQESKFFEYASGCIMGGLLTFFIFPPFILFVIPGGAFLIYAIYLHFTRKKTKYF